MKYIAILLVLVLLGCLVGTGYLYMTSHVTVDAARVIAVEANTQPVLFSQLADQLANDRLIGTRFTDQPLDDASSYQFYTYTLRLKNNTFLTADMVEVHVTPMDGDVLQIGDLTPRALAARTTGDLNVTILTAVGTHSVRELNITYYMWGIPFSTKLTYGK